MVKSKTKKSVAKAAGKKFTHKLSQMSASETEINSDKNTATAELSPVQDPAALAPKANGEQSGPRPAGHKLAQVEQSLGLIKTQSGTDLTEKIKELLRLAQEQGYLTYNDINDTLRDKV